MSDPVVLFLFLTETGITDRHNDCIIPRKSWRKIDTTCGCRNSLLYNTIALMRKSRTQAFPKVFCIFQIRYEKSGRVCLAVQETDCVTDLN